MTTTPAESQPLIAEVNQLDLAKAVGVDVPSGFEDGKIVMFFREEGFYFAWHMNSWKYEDQAMTNPGTLLITDYKTKVLWTANPDLTPVDQYLSSEDGGTNNFFNRVAKARGTLQ